MDANELRPADLDAISETNRGGFNEFTLNALRIVVGLLFMQHGAQKLFGALDGNQVELMTRLGLAGVLEFFGGMMVAMGLLTRPVAFLLSGQMAVAYFIAHFPRGFWPILNGGELSALFSFAFLFLFANGPGSFSIDGWLKAKKASAPID